MVGDFVTTKMVPVLFILLLHLVQMTLKLVKKYNIGILTMVDQQGKFVDGVGEFSNRYVKNYKDDPKLC